MPLTKKQIIEIQEAAKYNTLKLMREAENQKEFKQSVAKKINEAMVEKEVEPVEAVSKPAMNKVAPKSKSVKKGK